jgi:multidrug efflux system membrane fusion protein
MALHENFRISDAVPQQRSSRLNGVSRRSRLILYGTGALILALAAWYGLGGLLAPKRKAPPPPPVSVAAVQRRDVTVTQKTIGTVVSPATVQITAQVTGKLLAANFHEGDIVHKGDLLFQIDPAPYQAAEAQAEGQQARDTATLANDQVDLERYRTLARQNAISNQQLATQDAKVKSDQGVLETDKAAVQAARINLNFTRIVSPIDGKTGPILIQPGNVIPATSATAQPLVSITQVQPIKVSLMLPQNGLAQIQNQFNQHRLMAVVPLAGAPNGAETAPVNFVSNAVSASTGTIELRAEFPNADMRLVPGQTVTVAITINQIPGATVVPRDAVNLGPENSYVLVVDADGKAWSRTVKVLNDDGTYDAIQGDVKPGDKVVVNGQLRVTSGQAVRVTRHGKQGAAGGHAQAGAGP